LRALSSFVLAVLMSLAGSSAYASSITITVGDKDGFGQNLAAGADLPCLTNPLFDPNGPQNQTPCLSPIFDWRSTAEQLATNGARLTDTYSALYSGTESDCPAGCTLNGDTGTLIFPFSGELTSASITMLMGDFQSLAFNPMLANINGIPISFFYNHGYLKTAVETIVLTPEMLAAANLAGEVRLFLDHRATWDPQTNTGTGSFDYIAFDYAELNAEVVPEPSTWLLLGTGLAAILARRLRKQS